jgi:hypothetical protein
MQTQAAKPEASLPKRAPSHPPIQPEHPILHLQRAAGNQAMMRMMRTQSGAATGEHGASAASMPSVPPVMLQRKLAIHEPGDSYEQEADRAAEHVMRMPSPVAAGSAVSSSVPIAQLKAAGPSGAGGGEAPSIVHEVLRSPGQPLDGATRSFMEPRFGHDFSNVRVHTDAKAAESASAVQARAYTVGKDVVFGAGEFAPRSHEGQRLLGHELAHVVQQNGSPAAAPQIQRDPTKKNTNEEEKKAAVKDHEAQQKNVAALLDDARKLQTTKYSSATDANVLFRNSVELLDSGKITLFVLTPTHYSKPDKPVFFDQTFKYTQAKPVGGDYPADPAASSSAVDHPSPGESGGVPKAPQMPTFTPAPPKGGAPPPAATPAPPQWTSAFMKLYLPRTPVTKDELRSIFVHEAQHVADWSHLKPATLSDWKSILEEYKSEFRAYWVQPGFSMFDATPLRSAGNPVSLPNSRTCTACPAPVASTPGLPPPPRQHQTNLKNKRQSEIFWKLINEYQHAEFDCFYVCNKNFRDAVDNFDLPVAENLVNSVRLVNAHIELQKLTPGISGAALLKTGFPQAMKDLDSIDWEFLRDDKLSAPFWDLFTTFAPAVLIKEFKALAKKGTPSANDIDKVIALVK